MDDYEALADQAKRGTDSFFTRFLLIAIAFVVLALGFVRSGPLLGVHTPRSASTVALANLRACPRLDCDVLATLEAGRMLEVTNKVKGQTALGTNDWYEVTYGNRRAFVSAPVLGAEDSLGPWFELGMIGLGTIAMLGFGFLSSSITTRRALSHSSLYTIAAGMGVAICVLAYFVGKFSGQSLTDFWQGALINLGSGLLGAAVTFVLFETLVRKASSEQLKRTIADIADLRTAIGRVEARIGVLGTPQPADDQYPYLRRFRRGGRLLWRKFKQRPC